jgi:hypothetical protein
MAPSTGGEPSEQIPHPARRASPALRRHRPPWTTAPPPPTGQNLQRRTPCRRTASACAIVDGVRTRSGTRRAVDARGVPDVRFRIGWRRLRGVGLAAPRLHPLSPRRGSVPLVRIHSPRACTLRRCTNRRARDSRRWASRSYRQLYMALPRETTSSLCIMDSSLAASLLRSCNRRSGAASVPAITSGFAGNPDDTGSPAPLSHAFLSPAATPALSPHRSTSRRAA